MKLEHATKDKFIKRFLKLAPTVSLEDLAALVWEYANDEWSKGYGLGVRGLADEKDAKPDV